MKIVKTKAVVLLFFAGLLMLPSALFAQKKESLVIFPFTGSTDENGNAIAGRFARQPALQNIFQITPVTRATIAAMNFEQRFQRNSGLTDVDTIFELGKALNADYVMAGFITKFDNLDLVIVSIMNVESLQQIAGNYEKYRAGAIEEIAKKIPDMAQKLAVAAKRDTKNLAGLAVPPFDLLNAGAKERQDAMVLAQILACDLANGGKYAVLPRTDNLEKVREEHRRQQDGTTDRDQIKRRDAGRNAQYVLSGSVERLGNLNTFGVQILDIEKGTVLSGSTAEEDYTTFAQGYELMQKIAVKLSGGGTESNFVRVEGGTFQMGSNNGDSDEKPIHTVTVKSFSISKYEVTQKEWQEVMGNNPSGFKGDNRPVENVSWYEAVDYCNKRSIKERLTPVYKGSGDNITCDWNANGYRLPTEAEWEFAAKGGTKEYLTTEYSGSNSVDVVAWYSGNSGNSTHPVGTKAANSLGIYDMSGNVWEWCWDWYGGYSSGSQTDPRGAVSGAIRVFRGGSWCIRLRASVRRVGATVPHRVGATLLVSGLCAPEFCKKNPQGKRNAQAVAT